MGTFSELFTNFAFIGLIILAIFSFVILFQDENNAEEQMIDNSLMNETYSQLREDLTGYRDQSQTQKTLFEIENPTAGFGTILLFSIVSSGKVFNSMIIGTFNVLIKLPAVFLGVDPAVISVLSTMLIISIILGLWILYKLG